MQFSLTNYTRNLQWDLSGITLASLFGASTASLRPQQLLPSTGGAILFAILHITASLSHGRNMECSSSSLASHLTAAMGVMVSRHLAHRPLFSAVDQPEHVLKFLPRDLRVERPRCASCCSMSSGIYNIKGSAVMSASADLSDIWKQIKSLVQTKVLNINSSLFIKSMNEIIISLLM